MTRLNDLGRPTDPGDDAIARVRSRLGRELDPAQLRTCLQAVPVPGEGSVQRVMARLDGVEPGPPPPSPWPRRLAAGTGVLAILASIGVVAWMTTPTPPAPAPSPAVLQGPISDLELAGITLDATGRGQAGGTSDAPELRWSRGTLTVTAQPERTVHLVTREARASATGADVSLVRDPLGSHLDVRAGTADITCLVAPGAPRTLPAGAAATCPPVSVDGMLGRVRALPADTPLDTILDEVQAALDRPDGTEAARAEAGALRASTLARLGREHDALAAARDWLDAGHTLRRADVQRLAAGLALKLEGCPGALPHLRALASDDIEARAARDTCLGER